MKKIKIEKRFLIFLIVLLFGIILFLLGLGDTGLVDETPPLFASAGRSMSKSGDWLTPKVNGILRFDKPPLFYWLMALFYSLPKNEIWDNLGSLSARLPSALASLFMMLMISDTVICLSKKTGSKKYLSLVASLGFALSPLVIIWSKTAVSDSLLCGTIGISLLLFWRKIVNTKNGFCLWPWIILGLAILTKGPVALIIIFLTLTSFLTTQKNWQILLNRINPIKGIFITFFISFPWYFLEFLKEGQDFLISFFGYHNLQRYTSVVNNHSEPWWFFILIMTIGSFPFSIFLFHGIFETGKDLILNFKKEIETSTSLYIFSFCWLISVFVFFSISATKLPSYWIPATPAAAILISKSANVLINKAKNISLIWLFTSFITLGFSIALFLSDSWLVLINDPEMPNLASVIQNSGLLIKTRIFFSILTLASIFFTIKFLPRSVLYLQVLLFSGQFFVMLSIRKIVDNLRQLPLRNISAKILDVRKRNEPLAMVGIRKPSLHFYSNQIVFYESNSPVGMINLSERFLKDKRVNLMDKTNYDSVSFLVVIDKYSREKKHWSNINHQKLGVYGIYNLIRIKNSDLNKFAIYFNQQGINSDWKVKKFEKF